MASQEDRKKFSMMLDSQSAEETRIALKERRYGEHWKIVLAEERIRRNEESAKARSRLQQEISELSNKTESLRSGLLRTAIIGNAGGTIATLSFMGTIVGAGGTYDYRALLVLILFLIGLIFGVCARGVEWKIVSATFLDAINLLSDGGTSDDLYGYPVHLERLLWWLIRLCYTALILATIAGLTRLAALATG